MWYLNPQLTNRHGNTAVLMAHLSENDQFPAGEVEIAFTSGLTDISGNTASDFVIRLEEIREALPDVQLELTGGGMALRVTAPDLDKALKRIIDYLQEVCQRSSRYSSMKCREIEIV